MSNVAGRMLTGATFLSIIGVLVTGGLMAIRAITDVGIGDIAFFGLMVATVAIVCYIAGMLWEEVLSDLLSRLIERVL